VLAGTAVEEDSQAHQHQRPGRPEHCQGLAGGLILANAQGQVPLDALQLLVALLAELLDLDVQAALADPLGDLHFHRPLLLGDVLPIADALDLLIVLRIGLLLGIAEFVFEFLALVQGVSAGAFDLVLDLGQHAMPRPPLADVDEAAVSRQLVQDVQYEGDVVEIEEDLALRVLTLGTQVEEDRGEQIDVRD
jgi:hypothetical protein